jgi:hypothetical protein
MWAAVLLLGAVEAIFSTALDQRFFHSNFVSRFSVL